MMQAASEFLMEGNLPGFLSHGLGLLKDLNKDMKEVMDMQPYMESMNKCVSIMANLKARMTEEEQQVVEHLRGFREQSNLAIDEANKVASAIKTSASSFISALQGPSSEAAAACIACEKYVMEIKTLKQKVADVKKQLQTARQTGYRAKDSINNVLPAFERIQKEVMKELDESKAAQRTQSYLWSLMGLLAGPVGVGIAYGISVPVTECALIPNLEEHFNAQKEDVSKATERFKEMDQEIDNMIGSLDTHIQWMSDLENHLDTLNSSCEAVYNGALGLSFLTKEKIKLVIVEAQKLVELCG